MNTSEIVIDVLAYPRNSPRRKLSIKNLERLAQILESKCSFGLPLRIRDTAETSPLFADFVWRFLECCPRKVSFDLRWIFELISIIDHDWVYEPGKTDFNGQKAFLNPFAREAKDRAGNLKPAPKALFIALDGTRFTSKTPMAKYGECYGQYPDYGIAIEFKGYPQSEYHECLHQLGVSEGYDTITTLTLPGCERCWMQYDATKGEGLCARHQEELRAFAVNLKG